MVGSSWHAAKRLPSERWISPVLLVDGRMVGTWRHTLAGSRVAAGLQPFVQLPAWVRLATAARCASPGSNC